MNTIRTGSLVLAGLGVLLISQPGSAESGKSVYGITSQRTQDSIRTEAATRKISQLHSAEKVSGITSQRTQDNGLVQSAVRTDSRQRIEVSRGIDLRAMMENNLAKARDAAVALQEKIASVKARIQEETQSRMLNVKDITERNKVQQDINRALQQERMRTAQDRVRDMNQQVKDRMRR